MEALHRNINHWVLSALVGFGGTLAINIVVFVGMIESLVVG